MATTISAAQVATNSTPSSQSEPCGDSIQHLDGELPAGGNPSAGNTTAAPPHRGLIAQDPSEKRGSEGEPSVQQFPTGETRQPSPSITDNTTAARAQIDESLPSGSGFTVDATQRTKSPLVDTTALKAIGIPSPPHVPQLRLRPRTPSISESGAQNSLLGQHEALQNRAPVEGGQTVQPPAPIPNQVPSPEPEVAPGGSGGPVSGSNHTETDDELSSALATTKKVNPFAPSAEKEEEPYVTELIKFLTSVAADMAQERPNLDLKYLEEDIVAVASGWAGMDRVMGYPGREVRPHAVQCSEN